jgi:photosystem II stability/assembly factor-like uncharacterized protein
MRSRFLTVLILAFFWLGVQPPPAPAQRAAPALGWKSIGPPGGDVADIVSSPNDASRLYAVIKSDHGQLFTSADAGQRWTRLSVFSEPVYSIAVNPSDPGMMYVLGRTAVMKSADGGASWSRTELGSHRYGENGEIAIHPLNSNLVMATGFYSYNAQTSGETCVAFFKSTDAGGSWSLVPVNPVRYEGRGLGLAVNPFDVNEAYIGGYEIDPFLGVSGKIYKTVDGGSNWMDVSVPGIYYAVESIILDPGNPARVFAGTPWYVFRSTDGGQTWSQNMGQAFAHELVLDPLNANTLYAGWTHSVYRSMDGGITWSLMPAGPAGDCQSLLVSGGNVFYGSDLGVFKSGNAGATWQASQDGLNASTVQSFAVAPLWPRLIYAAIGSRIFKSTDFGETWVEPPFVLDLGTVGQIAVNVSNPDALYAVMKGCGMG